MEFKITRERILEAASKCSTARTTLEILFPEAFDDSDRDSEHFCTVGQALKRQGYGHIYAVIMVEEGLFQLMNVSQGKFWDYCKKTSSYLGIGPDGCLTRGMFKKLLENVSFSINEFSVR